MTARNIYIREIGDFVKTYHVGEYVKDKWKEQLICLNKDEIVDYFRGNDKYVAALRKRGKRTKMFVEIGDKGLANEVAVELEKTGFSARIMSNH